MKSIEDMTEPEVTTVAKLGQAMENMTKAAEWLDDMQNERNLALAELRDLGWTIREVSEVSGLSTAFVHKVTAKKEPA